MQQTYIVELPKGQIKFALPNKMKVQKNPECAACRNGTGLPNLCTNPDCENYQPPKNK